MPESYAEQTNLLDWMYRDAQAVEVFSLFSTYKSWVRVEIALAQGQSESSMISLEDLRAIEELSDARLPDFATLRASSLNVGYPIIELLSHLNSQLPESHRGVLHIGATTQDIMDSGLALQILDSGELLLEHIKKIGDNLALLTKKHALTLMPGRTHAQQAVPTTFGLKCAIYLAEIDRHRARLAKAFSDAARISLYGAAGTSAAMGENANDIRRAMAQKLNLHDELIPWHVSRDRLIDLTSQCGNLCVTLVRFAREIIDLSRNEINEVSEPGGHYKGASSTMPQKRNPVMSEAIIGVGLSAISQANAMFRAGEVGHERAAGEWQLEWKAFPEVIIDTITAAKITHQLIVGLSINSQAMRSNIDLDNGSIMAEAYMIELARIMGREKAHDLVHQGAQVSASENLPLHVALARIDPLVAENFSTWPLDPSMYIGNAQEVCDYVLKQWGTNSAK